RHARPVARLACSPDLPQGLLKKIQFDLLLADLAFQLGNPFARRRKVLGRLKIEHPKSLAGSTGRPQRLRPAVPEVPPPLVQMPRRNPKLPGERRSTLPSHHPFDRRELELAAEYTALAFGHRSPLENCPLFLCRVLGGHSTMRGGRRAVRDDPPPESKSPSLLTQAMRST